MLKNGTCCGWAEWAEMAGYGEPGTDRTRPATSDAYSVLRQVPLFATLSDEVLARLAGRNSGRTYPAGHVLFVTGEPSRGLWVVESGRVKTYRTSPSGREQILKTDGPGQAVGEVALLDGGPQPASAVTEEESRLLFIPREQFEALYRDDPAVARLVIRELAHQLRHLVHLTQTLAYRDVAARLANYLVEYALRFGQRLDDGAVDIVIDRTHEELSFELGAARESVSRAFKQLVRKGLLAPLPGKRYRISSMARLRAVGRPGQRGRYE